MTTHSEEHFAFATLARQGARFTRDVPAGALARIAAVAPGLGALHVSLAFRFDASGRVRISGDARQAVEAVCQRCAERLTHDLAVSFDLCVVRDGAVASELAELVDVVVVAGDTVTLAEVVEDELLLALPEALCLSEPCPNAPLLAFPADEARVVEEAAEAASGPFDILSTLKKS